MKDAAAGRKGKCSKCGAVVQVPQLADVQSAAPNRTAASESSRTKSATAQAASSGSPAKASAEPAVRDRLLAGISGPIKPVRTSLFYRVGMLWASVVMVVLPLIYIGVIALAAWAVYYHLVNHVGMLTVVRGRGALVMFVLYAGPIVAGGIMVLFMIKPLFAPPAEEGRTRSLTRQGEPVLFEFVDHLCESVGAPRPDRIRVDADMNASASFGEGWRGLFSRELILTIGTPLAAGLTVEQFAGVLAHEFGHFSQGMAMRLSFLVRLISHWFVRVVYERDAWDAWLEEAHEDTEWYIALVVGLAQLCVWLSRRVLWVLMYVGHLVAGFLVRQMEYDADLHETRFAGSDTFEATSHQLRTLGVTYGGVMQELGTYISSGKLPDNLPKLVVARAKTLPPEVAQRIRKSYESESTGLFDTHPCDKARIAAARREDTPGVFQCDGPASILFTDFDTLARNSTGDFYRGIFGIRFNTKVLRPTESMLEA